MISLARSLRACNNYCMSGTKKYDTLTKVLREAIDDCELSFAELGRESGLKRQSLMKFASGEQSLRLDMADTLAEYFGIECVRREQ